MRIVLILLLHVALLGQSYNFEEIKFVSAVGTDFRQSGKIDISDKKVIITYEKPRFKQIIKADNNITIKGASGDVYTLKGKALYYTGLFIDVMTKIGDIDKIKSNRDFKVERADNTLYLTFLGDLADTIIKAEVKIADLKVVSFKMFMPNEDTLTIIKK
jgi:hypothetical protein